MKKKILYVLHLRHVFIMLFLYFTVPKPTCSMKKTADKLGGDYFYMSVYTNSIAWCQLACVRDEECWYASAVPPMLGWFPCQLYHRESRETRNVTGAVFFEKECKQGRRRNLLKKS